MPKNALLFLCFNLGHLSTSQKWLLVSTLLPQPLSQQLQLRHWVPGEASDTRFYHKPRWFSTDQATKSRRISKMVSRLGKNSSSRPVPVFIEFKYSVIYGKMFFQQEITDAKASTLYTDC